MVHFYARLRVYKRSLGGALPNEDERHAWARGGAEDGSNGMGEKESEAAVCVAEVVGSADAGGTARREEGEVDVAGAVGVAAGAAVLAVVCGLQLLHSAMLKQIGSARTPAPAAERSQGGAAPSFD